MSTEDKDKDDDRALFWTVIEKVKDFTDALTIRRLIVSVVTSVLLISTFTIYENRGMLAQGIMNYFGESESAKDWSVSPESAATLVNLVKSNTLIKLVLVTEIDLQKNRRLPRYWFLDDPSEPEIRKRVQNMLPQAVFDYDPKNTAQLVGVLNNEFVCAPYTDTIFNRLFPELAKTTPVICRLAVPPFYGRFVGILTIGLSENPSKDQLDALRIEIARLSVEIYLRDVVKKPIP